VSDLIDFWCFVPAHSKRMTISDESDPSLIVVAAILGPNRGIGLNNDLPWPSIPADLAWLQRITTKLPSHAHPSHKMNAVLLGRVTWQSGPVQEMHLPQRHNVVISRQRSFTV
jgi:dihydrofolate reductase